MARQAAWPHDETDAKTFPKLGTDLSPPAFHGNYEAVRKQMRAELSLRILLSVDEASIEHSEACSRAFTRGLSVIRPWRVQQLIQVIASQLQCLQ